MSRTKGIARGVVWVALTVAVVGSRTADGGVCANWVDHSVTAWPDGRSMPAMAYDSARRVMVLFGGTPFSFFGNEYLDSRTWEWDGLRWLVASADGPSGRFGAAMIYDSARGTVVLHGGRTLDGYLGDTWEWNGANWTLMSITGPSPRYLHAMAYDSARGVAVLVGGVDAMFGSLADTWEWDGTSWVNVGVFDPGPVSQHGMAYDAARGATVLVADSETWEWDGLTWALRSDSSPDAVLNAPAMTYDEARQVIVLYIHDDAETWEWDGSTWNQRSTTGPRRMIDLPAMAYDGARGVSVLFGGNSSLIDLDETWEWDGSSWVQRLRPEGLEPSRRQLNAMAYDSTRKVTVLFGGFSFEERSAVGDTWEWDGAAWNLRSTSGPSPQVGAAMVYDSARGVTVLFGKGDTWEWDGLTWNLRSTTGPPPRSLHAMVYDAARGATVLFGGQDLDLSQLFDDTWEWDGSAWILRSTTGPSPRYLAAMAYDSARGKTVLFGGMANSYLAGDTWEWNGLAWTRRSKVGPSARYLSAMSYDPILGAAVLFSGKQSYAGVADTWAWDGAQWTILARTGPPPRGGHAMVYDHARDTFVVFGGFRPVYSFGDTWELQFGCSTPGPAPVPETYQSCPGTCYATKNRYLSMIPPPVPEGANGVALRVTLGPMPGSNDCPGVPDYSAFDGTQMWVGEEVLEGGVTPTGVYGLQTQPLYRDWTTVECGVVQVSDCNIVPCATYTIQAIDDSSDPEDPDSYSAPLVLSTTPVWGDVTAGFSASDGGFLPADGTVSFTDIGAVVDCFKGFGPPKTWCDLALGNPTLNVNFSDIGMCVDAFKEIDYAFPGPSAPIPCPEVP